MYFSCRFQLTVRRQTRFLRHLNGRRRSLEHGHNAASNLLQNRRPTSLQVLPNPVSIPNCSYKQNTGLVEQNGRLSYINNTRHKFITMIDKDIPTVPTDPSPTLDPLVHTPQAMQFLVSNLRKFFLERPITTRRAIFNGYLSRYGLGDPDSPRDIWRPILRYALPYVCYMFKSGPFRDAYVVFGLDPRKEQTWAKYQTAFFSFRQGKARVARGEDGDGQGVWEMRNNHLFTGKDVGTKVVCYSFVDIVDPMVRKVIDESPFREKFHVPAHTRGLRLMSRRMMGGIRRKRYCG